MASQEISREQWHQFCHDFSRQHQGWLMTLKTEETEDQPAQDVAVEQPFWGITADEHEGQFTISIMTGEQFDHYVHIVNRPARLFIDRMETGEDMGLRLDAEDEPSVTMEFRVPAFPEILDEISAREVSF